MKYIIKRDGSKVLFEKRKITKAILNAMWEVHERDPKYEPNKTTAQRIANEISKIQKKTMKVEEVQDLVETKLMDSKHKEVAKAYILYRDERTRIRGGITDNVLNEFLNGQNEYWNKENSNKDARVVTTQRDYIAGITSTDIARRFLLPRDVCQAHDEGIIHQHDMDYMAQKALSNCCLVNLEDMLENGTVINGVKIEKQHRITTAATVATQIITAVASSQYGGTTITLTHLAPYVRDSFWENFNYGLKFLNKDISEIPYDRSRTYDEYKSISEEAYNYAYETTKINIKDAVQTFNYQINSMSTTNGQAPFLSVSMHIDENPEYQTETAWLIEEFLNQRIKGMQNDVGVYVTPAFPKLLYVLDENNIHEDSPYYYLTELAAKCTAKRMVPDYISAKKMREYKISQKTGKGTVYPCMGK